MLGPKAHTDPLLSWQLEDNSNFYIRETWRNDKKSLTTLFCYGGICINTTLLLIGCGVFFFVFVFLNSDMTQRQTLQRY